MCELTSALSAAQLASSAGKVVLGFMGGSKQAKDQNNRYLQNAKNVQAATSNRYEVEQLQALQAGEAAGADKLDIAKQALQARSAARVSSGEAGVTGLSAEALARDVYRQEADAKGRVEAQAEFTDQVSAIEYSNIELSSNSQIQAVRRGKGPSPVALMLELAGVGIDAQSARMQRKGTGNG